MNKAYTHDIVLAAEHLYVADQKTFREISKAMSIAESTLKRWASSFGWHRKRQSFRKGEENLYDLFLEISTKAKETKKIVYINTAQSLYKTILSKNTTTITT